MVANTLGRFETHQSPMSSSCLLLHFRASITSVLVVASVNTISALSTISPISRRSVVLVDNVVIWLICDPQWNLDDTPRDSFVRDRLPEVASFDRVVQRRRQVIPSVPGERLVAVDMSIVRSDNSLVEIFAFANMEARAWCK